MKKRQDPPAIYLDNARILTPIHIQVANMQSSFEFLITITFPATSQEANRNKLNDNQQHALKIDFSTQDTPAPIFAYKGQFLNFMLDVDLETNNSTITFTMKAVKDNA